MLSDCSTKAALSWRDIRYTIYDARSNSVLKLLTPFRPVARIFAGRVRMMSAFGAKCRAPQARAGRGVWGYSPPENFEKMGSSEAAFRAF